MTNQVDDNPFSTTTDTLSIKMYAAWIGGDGRSRDVMTCLLLDEK